MYIVIDLIPSLLIAYARCKLGSDSKILEGAFEGKQPRRTWKRIYWRLLKSDYIASGENENWQFSNILANMTSYQLYRNTTLGHTLQESLDELIQVV